ncbi:MAG: ABC transporter [Gammaproteobacteria bacterium]|nr:MAG: ABC transporter [Gammaproteobacteria bacterium]
MSMKKHQAGPALKIQNLVFTILFLLAVILLAWLSQRYHTEFDLTWGQRNSLTQASVDILAQLDKPVHVTAFVRDETEQTRQRIRDLLAKYQRHKVDIELEFTNPDTVPQMVRELGITLNGEILVRYQQRQETLKSVNEKNITNLLQRLARQESGFIAFIEGHGERSPLGKANFDLGDFAKQLEDKGFKLQPINLAKHTAIPENIHALVIASPRSPYLPGELELIEQYIDQGGNLLWLTEPGSNDGLQSLASKLDIQRLPGIVVDATTRLFGISDPTFALVTDYPRHEITEPLHSLTLFPESTGLVTAEESEWQLTPLLQTLQRSWTETGEIKDDIRFDPQTEETAGPITIGLLLQRSSKTTTSSGIDSQKPTQRVILIGDGDFLSNTYLGNGQNLNLGVSLFQWLSDNDQFIDIGVLSAPDTQLHLDPSIALTMLIIFLVLLPLAMVTSGVVIWWRRRSR